MKIGWQLQLKVSGDLLDPEARITLGRSTVCLSGRGGRENLFTLKVSQLLLFTGCKTLTTKSTKCPDGCQGCSGTSIRQMPYEQLVPAKPPVVDEELKMNPYGSYTSILQENNEEEARR